LWLSGVLCGLHLAYSETRNGILAPKKSGQSKCIFSTFCFEKLKKYFRFLEIQISEKLKECQFAKLATMLKHQRKKQTKSEIIFLQIKR